MLVAQTPSPDVIHSIPSPDVIHSTPSPDVNLLTSITDVHQTPTTLRGGGPSHSEAKLYDTITDNLSYQDALTILLNPDPNKISTKPPMRPNAKKVNYMLARTKEINQELTTGSAMGIAGATETGILK